MQVKKGLHSVTKRIRNKLMHHQRKRESKGLIVLTSSSEYAGTPPCSVEMPSGFYALNYLCWQGRRIKASLVIAMELSAWTFALTLWPGIIYFHST